MDRVYPRPQPWFSSIWRKKSIPQRPPLILISCLPSSLVQPFLHRRPSPRPPWNTLTRQAPSFQRSSLWTLNLAPLPLKLGRPISMASIHDLCNPEPEEDRPYRPGNKPEQPPSSVPYHPEGMQPHPSRHYSEYSEHSESGTHFNHHSHDRHPRHHPQHYHPYHSSQHKHHHQSNPDEQRYGHSSHNERWTYESKHPYDSQPNGPSHSYDHPMSYQEESKSHFREHTNSTSSGRSIGQDSATTSSIEGSSGNAQNHSIKSEHAHQNAVRSAGLRPDER